MGVGQKDTELGKVGHHMDITDHGPRLTGTHYIAEIRCFINKYLKPASIEFAEDTRHLVRSCSTLLQALDNAPLTSWNYAFINPASKYVIPAAEKRRAGIQNSPYFLDSRFRGNDSGVLKVRCLFNCHVNNKSIQDCLCKIQEVI
jgi:hypothetical protein